MMSTVACRLHVAPFVIIGVNLRQFVECKDPDAWGAKVSRLRGRLSSNISQRHAENKVDHCKLTVFTSQCWLRVFHSILYGPCSGYQRPQF